MNKALPFARKRKGITNYRKRLALLKSAAPRAVVRKSLQHVIVQLVASGEKGDKVLAAADSKELSKYGWNAGGGNIPAAYLTGYLLGLRVKKTTPRVVLDMGLRVSTRGAGIYAAVKGMIDAGLDVPHDEKILPDPARITGKHIQEFALALLKENKEKYEKQFSAYMKKGFAPEKIEAYFTATKEQISKKP